MGKTNAAIISFAGSATVLLWFGKNGLHDYTRVNDDVTAQQQATNAKFVNATISVCRNWTTSTAGRKRLRSVRAMNSA